MTLEHSDPISLTMMTLTKDKVGLVLEAMNALDLAKLMVITLA